MHIRQKQNYNKSKMRIATQIVSSFDQIHLNQL